ncbi:hypothetical protein Vretimale_1579 [Volvox reticuliferus]|uniref:Uncharacterized protein n=1 Tax=Volvox reticuliferus TaxID=1737510 RepID=A0A8J4CRH1_9CHLO|nr:hypothetical protein Vretifemale_15556 [Volvox reticuliferus]GIL95615.1 hypothetical protein Vretimale_1579 [Volvox reticuliferus]
MLSWNDDGDAFTKRSPITKSTSLTRPGNSFEAQRTASSRKSVDVPAQPVSRKSTEANSSPTDSLTKANSLLRGPGNAAKGTIGSEGWWHHMDNSQMNEPPTEAVKTAGQVKPTAFVPQYSITGERKSLWADEVPAAAASPPESAAPFLGEYSIKASETLKNASEAVPATAAAAQAPVSVVNGDGGATIQNAGTTGWWAHMDNSILNKPAETAPLEAGAVRKGERVMGGGFAPQFNVAGGNRYGSIFADESVQRQQQQQQHQAAEQGDTKALLQEVAEWGPFCGQQGGSADVGAIAEDEWSNFATAPKA